MRASRTLDASCKCDVGLPQLRDGSDSLVRARGGCESLKARLERRNPREQVVNGRSLRNEAVFEHCLPLRVFISHTRRAIACATFSFHLFTGACHGHRQRGALLQ